MAIRRDDFPLPDVDDPLTAPYFAGAARGELMITRCDACDEYVWYPQEHCPQLRGSRSRGCRFRARPRCSRGRSCGARSSPRSRIKCRS